MEARGVSQSGARILSWFSPAMANCAPISRHLLFDITYKTTVRITGWIDSEQVREEILAARALVLPSFSEGLPVVIMEAMALRRPVISTFVGGIPELVHPDEHGWLVPAGDVDALVHAMQTCLDASAETCARHGRSSVPARACSPQRGLRKAPNLLSCFEQLLKPVRGTNECRVTLVDLFLH